MKSRICLRFKLEKKLNIGTGSVITKITADNPVFKIDDQIVTPASTIKGLLRTSLIKVSGLLGYNDITSSINPEKWKKMI
jgi:CRISPR/Cas system CSM-associated protein Csm3 (group 7 of RAMP superfamily)